MLLSDYSEVGRCPRLNNIENYAVQQAPFVTIWSFFFNFNVNVAAPMVENAIA
jgi:hypothetical protein